MKFLKISFFFFLYIFFVMKINADCNTNPTDLKVTTNIYINNSTSMANGNILKNNVRFIHNFGTDNTKDNTFVGMRAGNFTTQGASNSGFGVNALRNNGTGRNNTAIGVDALTANTVGNSNTAVGQSALSLNQTGNDNTGVGKNALHVTVGGSRNSALGRDSLGANTQGNDNTAVGHSALAGNTEGIDNTAIGVDALQNNSIGNDNTGIGKNALRANTTGIQNTVIGTNALQNNVGDSNIAIGKDALTSLTNGKSNTVLGAQAGKNLVSGIANNAPAEGNIFVGFQAGSTMTQGSNNICIGNVGVAQEDGVIRISTMLEQQKCIMPSINNVLSGAGSAVTINTNDGEWGIMTSSRKFKHSINRMSEDEAMHIGELNPVTFMYNNDATAKKQYGLIAEDVDRILPGLVIKDNNHMPLSVRYEIIPVLLVHEMKKQQKDIMHQEQIIETHTQNIIILKNIVDDLSACVQRFLSGMEADVAQVMVEDLSAFEHLDVDDMPMRLTVTDNISMVDSSDADHGNIIKTINRFIHNFGTNNTFVGVNSGNFTMNTQQATSNSGCGVNALQNLDTGNSNTAIGRDALAKNSVGNFNTAIGQEALFNNTAGDDNTAIGKSALNLNTIGSRNSALGREALRSNTIGNDNSAIGTFTLFLNTQGIDNVAVGRSALNDTISGNQNVAIGINVLQHNKDSNNTAVGANALQTLASETNSQNNTAIGKDSLLVLPIGNNNTVVGTFAGKSLQQDPNKNIFIGFNAGSLLTEGSNNIYIGSSGFAGTEYFTVRIGNPNIHTKCFIPHLRSLGANARLAINADGLLGYIASSRRFKNNIQNMQNSESSCIYDLHPVAFIYHNDQTSKQQYGLIAEEVDAIFPAMVVKDENNEPFSVRYDILPVLLLNEIKKQQQEILDHQQTIERHVRIMDTLKLTVLELRNQMKRIIISKQN